MYRQESVLPDRSIYEDRGSSLSTDFLESSPASPDMVVSSSSTTLDRECSSHSHAAVNQLSYVICSAEDPEATELVVEKNGNKRYVHGKISSSSSSLSASHKPASSPQNCALKKVEKHKNEGKVPARRRSENGTRLSYLPLSLPGDIILDPSDLFITVQHWSFCLVGFFASEHPGQYLLKKFVDQHWKVPASLTQHSSGWIFFRFTCSEHMNQILDVGPFLVYGRPLFIRALPLGFPCDVKEMAKIPIWIRLPNLPIHLWNPKGLGKIGSYVGKPLHTDKYTASLSKISFARILVEVDLNNDLPLELGLVFPSGHRVLQPIIYENLPPSSSLPQMISNGFSFACCPPSPKKDNSIMLRCKANSHDG